MSDITTPKRSAILSIPENVHLYSVEAEQQILGLLLLDNANLEKVLDFLKPHHFFRPVHQRIFQEIINLNTSRQEANPVTLQHLFQDDPELVAVGGAFYLIDLADGVISSVALRDYAQIVFDFSIRRDLIEIYSEAIDGLCQIDGEKTALEHLAVLEKKLYTLATTGSTKTMVVTFEEASKKYLETAEAAYKGEKGAIGLSTGFCDLDNLLSGGLISSDLLILAARPSMGKTALATNIAFNVASAGTPVLFFSLEMSAEQLAGRIICGEAGISGQSVCSGNICTEVFGGLYCLRNSIKDIPLFIDESPSLSVMHLRNRARQIKRQYGIGLIVIDYLQLIEADAKKGYTSNRVQEVSDITRALKGIAKDLDLPVLALSQLSRAVEQRDDKRPQLSDLRDSGSIEQDADVVMFLYREEYYEVTKEPTKGTEKHLEWERRMDNIYGKAEVLIAKQRRGRTGKVKLFFDKKLTRFGNLANDTFDS